MEQQAPGCLNAAVARLFRDFLEGESTDNPVLNSMTSSCGGDPE